MIMSSELYGSVMRSLRGYISIMVSRIGRQRVDKEVLPPGGGKLL